ELVDDAEEAAAEHGGGGADDLREGVHDGAAGAGGGVEVGDGLEDAGLALGEAGAVLEEGGEPSEAAVGGGDGGGEDVGRGQFAEAEDVAAVGDGLVEARDAGVEEAGVEAEGGAEAVRAVEG